MSNQNRSHVPSQQRVLAVNKNDPLRAQASGGEASTIVPREHGAQWRSVQNLRPVAQRGTSRRGSSQTSRTWAQRSNLRDAFPRLHAHTAAQDIELVERETNATRLFNEFRHKPKTNQLCFASGSFIWPVNDADPAALRDNHNKLDQIRNNHQCHIIFDSASSCFKVYSCDQINGETAVGLAIEALRNAFFECIAKLTKPIRLYIMQPPSTVGKVPFVRMSLATEAPASFKAAGVGAPGKVEMIAGMLPSGEEAGVSWKQEIDTIQRKNFSVLALATSTCLENIVYRPGRIQIRALFGEFIFTRYVKSSAPREAPVACDRPPLEPALKFMQNLRNPKTDGALYRLTPQTQLYKRVYKCEDLFESIEGFLTTRPYHTGIFTFPPEKGGDPADIQLRMVTSANNGVGSLAPQTEKYEWSSPDEQLNSRCLELYMTSLQRSMGCKIEVTAQQCYRLIRPELRLFSQAVRLMAPSERILGGDHAELMFDVSASTIRPKSFFQKTSWRYRLKANPDYIFEISRLDKFGLDAVLTRGPKSSADITTEARQPRATEWEACIFRNEWDEYLGQNLTLKTGQRANWSPELDTFFPSELGEPVSAGFIRFTKIVQNVADRIRGVSV